MKTVPTLCATSTVGAAAAGCSFGRNPSPPDYNLLLHPIPKNQPVQRSRGALSRGGSSSKKPETLQLQDVRPNTIEGVDLGGKKRVVSAGWEGHKRLSDLCFDNNSLSDHDHSGSESKGSVSSRRTWLRRLSALSTSRNPSPRPRSGPRPDVRSSPFSTASDPASQQHRTTPYTSAPPPNKLVKRCSSHRSSLRMISDPASVGGLKVLSLPRPATSHQRSATAFRQMFEQGGEHDCNEALVRPGTTAARLETIERSHVPPDGVRWRLHFQPRVLKPPSEATMANHKNSPSRPTQAAIKRILPSPTRRPYLVSPDCIEPSSDGPYEDQVAESGTSDQIDDDTFIFGRAPLDEPSGIDTLFQEKTLDPPKSAIGGMKRSSHSIGDLFGSSGSSWLPRSRASRRSKQDRIGLSNGRRYSSAPYTQDLISSGKARRDITDPTIFSGERNSDIIGDDDMPDLVSSGALPLANPGMLAAEQSVSSTLKPRHVSQQQMHGSSPDVIALSSSPATSSTRARHSSFASPSERASTLVGSDHEFRRSNRSADEETDFRSDTAFDSSRTILTNHSESMRPRLDHAFDILNEDNPSAKPEIVLTDVSIDKTNAYRDFLAGPQVIDPRADPENKPFANKAPLQPGLGKKENNVASPANSRESPGIQALYVEERDTGEKNIGRWLLDDNDNDADDDHEDDEDWARSDDDGEIMNQLSSPQSRKVLRADIHNRPMTDYGPRQRGIQHNNGIRHENDILLRLFEFDQGSPEPTTDSQHAQSQTHIDTQASDGRGGRLVGRRGSSLVHMRSQSVPVIADPLLQQERGAATSRFGTWGLGSKVVSEDWNEDFEFDVVNPKYDANQGTPDGQNADAGTSMMVPESIKSRQASVLGQFGHVRAFASLVEDLKQLTAVAASKGLLDGPFADLWREAAGVIDLATIDADDSEVLPHRNHTNPEPVPVTQEEDPAAFPTHGQGRRKSVLSLDDDIFGGSSATSRSTDQPTNGRSQMPNPPLSSKPGLGPSQPDAKAVARSVVETMRSRRMTSDPFLGKMTRNPQEKVHFDTTTLKDLVAHVSDLSRKLNWVIQEAGSLSSTPDGSSFNGAIDDRENDLSGPIPMMAAV